MNQQARTKDFYANVFIALLVFGLLAVLTAYLVITISTLAQHL